MGLAPASHPELLSHTITSADLKLSRLLERFDEHANARGIVVGEPYRPPATMVPAPQLELDLRTVRTVIWATGFRPTYPWLPPEVLDHGGAIQHDGGVMPVPGMYVLGLPFTRRRKPAFIDGVGPDAIDVVTHLADHLNGIKSSKSWRPTPPTYHIIPVHRPATLPP
jgi:putative flavoprotein involved in K+ transport